MRRVAVLFRHRFGIFFAVKQHELGIVFHGLEYLCPAVVPCSHLIWNGSPRGTLVWPCVLFRHRTLGTLARYQSTDPRWGLRLRKTPAGGRVFSFAKRSKSEDFGLLVDGIYLPKSYGYASTVRCMGCKGSSVRITPSRPYISTT